jgi:hypothetical protein
VIRIEEPLRITVSVCMAAALLCIGAGLLIGQLGPAAALAAGLLIGSCNGYLARGALGTELDFRATSMVRLLLLTAAAVGVAALAGVWAIPFAVAGLALAQIVLVVVSALRLVRS